MIYLRVSFSSFPSLFLAGINGEREGGRGEREEEKSIGGEGKQRKRGKNV